jgi:hypothetical protein
MAAIPVNAREIAAPQKTLGFSLFWALAELCGSYGAVGEIVFTSYVLGKKLPPHLYKCGGKDFALWSSILV